MKYVSRNELTCQSPKPTSRECPFHGRPLETPVASGRGRAGPKPWRARLLRLPDREKDLARYPFA